MIRVGCSGFYYPNWRNQFYPHGLSQKDWLSYYSLIFPTVELNGTFYRIPKSSDLKRYFQVTPDDFTFSVKMSRYITHVQRLTSRESITDFQTLLKDNLQNKLQYFLFQFPASFHYSEENLDRIVTHVPNSPNNVVEFRHQSWWNDDVRKILTQSAITFVNVDYPGLDSYAINTSPLFYLRLHGNPVLFTSSYDNAELEKFRLQIPDDATSVNVYFNNTMNAAGYENAAQFMGVISQNLVVNKYG
ncbi:MAG TPA: DUF72 domain-containing protein [Chryseolinea sp.]|nr:DUF72 domain-containing protein [Chryseolinea sp.]